MYFFHLLWVIVIILQVFNKLETNLHYQPEQLKQGHALLPVYLFVITP